MSVLHNPRVKSKGNGAAPSSRPYAPAPVISFPTALVAEQRRQEITRHQHGEDARSFKARLPGLVAHLHGLGIRPTAELLIEYVGNDEQAQNTLLLLLERYNRLDWAVVEAVGGDRYPPSIFAVDPT